GTSAPSIGRRGRRRPRRRLPSGCAPAPKPAASRCGRSSSAAAAAEGAAAEENGMSELHDPPRPGDDAGAAPDIAIVGLAARFPGAADAARFWENLRDGVEGIAALADEELLAAGVDPAHLADPRYVRAKGVLAGADRFDAGFFGFTPREAEVMDPQHRVFLECAWEALEDAGCDPSRFAGRIG